MVNEVYKLQKYLANAYLNIGSRTEFFTISVQTFEILDFVRFESPGNRFSFSEPVRLLSPGGELLFQSKY